MFPRNGPGPDRAPVFENPPHTFPQHRNAHENPAGCLPVGRCIASAACLRCSGSPLSLVSSDTNQGERLGSWTEYQVSQNFWTGQEQSSTSTHLGPSVQEQCHMSKMFCRGQQTGNSLHRKWISLVRPALGLPMFPHCCQKFQSHEGFPSWCGGPVHRFCFLQQGDDGTFSKSSRQYWVQTGFNRQLVHRPLPAHLVDRLYGESILGDPAPAFTLFPTCIPRWV